jgi:hypothetical protein
MSSGSLGDVVFIDHVNLRARGFTGSSEFDPLRLKILFSISSIFEGF